VKHVGPGDGRGGPWVVSSRPDRHRSTHPPKEFFSIAGQRASCFPEGEPTVRGILEQITGDAVPDGRHVQAPRLQKPLLRGGPGRLMEWYFTIGAALLITVDPGGRLLGKRPGARRDKGRRGGGPGPQKARPNWGRGGPCGGARGGGGRAPWPRRHAKKIGGLSLKAVFPGGDGPGGGN